MLFRSDGCANQGIGTCNITLVKVNSLQNSNNKELTLENTTTDADAKATPSEPSNVPTAHGDFKCFPNPFSDDLNLQYNLTHNVSDVVLKIYDNLGRFVTKQVHGAQGAGFYEMRWNLSDLSSGMYHVCLEIEGKCVKMERVIMIK